MTKTTKPYAGNPAAEGIAAATRDDYERRNAERIEEQIDDLTLVASQLRAASGLEVAHEFIRQTGISHIRVADLIADAIRTIEDQSASPKLSAHFRSLVPAKKES